MNAVEELKKLKPKKYNYKGSDKVCYGFIAQELQKVFPDMVAETPDGYLGIYYYELIPILVKAIQELSGELEELKRRIK